MDFGRLLVAQLFGWLAVDGGRVQFVYIFGIIYCQNFHHRLISDGGVCKIHLNRKERENHAIVMKRVHGRGLGKIFKNNLER